MAIKLFQQIGNINCFFHTLMICLTGRKDDIVTVMCSDESVSKSASKTSWYSLCDLCWTELHEAWILHSFRVHLPLPLSIFIIWSSIVTYFNLPLSWNWQNQKLKPCTHKSTCVMLMCTVWGVLNFVNRKVPINKQINKTLFLGWNYFITSSNLEK
jgi:hypothetical protein